MISKIGDRLLTHPPVFYNILDTFVKNMGLVMAGNAMTNISYDINIF